jgi:Asp-tRNA(Asn)/Glu-tRNA(Gln) amidotransferase A subunit family amidase
MAPQPITRPADCELVGAITDLKLSPVEIMEARLVATAKLNPGINAIVTLSIDEARRAAQRAEASVTRGEPLGCRSLLRTSRKPQDCERPSVPNSSNIMSQTEDAAVVTRLKTAGAIVIGKSNAPEFAAGAGTKNEIFGRSAPDAALMLDAMIGFSSISPISVIPSWWSAKAIVEATRDLKGRSIAYVSDIAGTGVDAEVDRICRKAVFGLQSRGEEVEEIEFDVSEGRSAYQVLRGLGMVGQRYDELDRLEPRR